MRTPRFAKRAEIGRLMGICRKGHEDPAFCARGCVVPPCGRARAAIRCRPSCDGVVKKGSWGVSAAVATRSAKSRTKVTCGDCFFGRHGLCALELDEACATFRPDHPEGLRPPSQMRF